MIKDLIKNMSAQMDKTVDALRKEFQKVRTGRASTSLLDDDQGRLLRHHLLRSISWRRWLFPSHGPSPFSRGKPKIIAAIEKAIINANLGLTPSNDGRVIRLNLPPLTEERRKDIVKQLRKVGRTPKSPYETSVATRSMS